MKRVVLDFLKGLWFGIWSLVGFVYITLSTISFCKIHTLEVAWEAVMVFCVAILALAFGVKIFISFGKYIRELEEIK